MLKELYRATKWFLVLSFLFISVGCAQKVIYQVDGKPIHTNIIQSRVLNLDAKVTYNLVKSFRVKEDDEFFDSYEFLSFFDEKIYSIESGESLYVNIDVFNPTKGYYKLVSILYSEDNTITTEETLYEGDISRNSLSVNLPLDTEGMMSFYYSLFDEKGNLLFTSFRARYISKINKTNKYGSRLYTTRN